MKKIYNKRFVFFILVSIALIMILALIGCTKVETVPKSDDDISMFVEVEYTNSWKIVYHKETRVMYAVSNGGYNSGDFTVLVNPDGTPMLYEGS